MENTIHADSKSTTSRRWWPDADWEDLYTAMLFTVCLFVWDDIIDTNEHELASDYAAASVWREQSLAYFQYHLQLGPAGQGEPRCPDDVCLIFKEFGQRFCANFGDEQRRRMFSKIQNFVEHNDLEQAERVAGRIPDYDSYMHIRYGVTGVRMFSLLLEYVNISIEFAMTSGSESIANALPPSLQDYQPVQTPIIGHGFS